MFTSHSASHKDSCALHATLLQGWSCRSCSEQPGSQDASRLARNFGMRAALSNKALGIANQTLRELSFRHHALERVAAPASFSSSPCFEFQFPSSFLLTLMTLLIPVLVHLPGSQHRRSCRTASELLLRGWQKFQENEWQKKNGRTGICGSSLSKN